MSQQQWRVFVNDKWHGPATAQQLRQLADQGKITPETWVIADGMQKPIAASRVSGLFNASSGTQPPLPEVRKPPIVAPRPQSSTVITVAPAAVPMHRPPSDDQAFPLVLKIVCGVAGLALLILALTVVFNVRTKQHAVVVTAASKSADELLRQSEAAFQAGDLTEADALATQAESIKHSERREAATRQRTKIAAEKERLAAASRLAELETQKRTAEAERLALANKKAPEERLAANGKQEVKSLDNQPATLTTEQIVAQAEPSVAFIKGRFSSGTGFLVRPGIVATNKHVIETELIDNIKVHFPSANSDARGPFSVQLLYEDPERDLAFLSVNTSLPALKMAPQHSFRRGQDVIVIGSPGVGDELVLQNAISRGVMSTKVEIKGHEYYQLGISINSGNSGGPVLDMAGQLIGVVTLKASKQEGLGFCIPLPQLNAAVAALDGLSSQEIAAIRSQHRLRVVFTFVGVTGGLYKTGMEAYTAAMEYAIKEGVDVNIGLQVARRQVEDKLSASNQVLIGDLKLEVSKITTDPNIPEATRQRFVDLWTNYLELKSYVDDPRGNFDSYKAKYNELSDKHARLTQSLKLLLGIGD